jgi:hypothetical protein
MKKLLIILVLFVSCLANSQSSPSLANLIFSPGGLLEDVFDQDGNAYKLKDIVVGQKIVGSNGQVLRSTSPISVDCGYFRVFYETGSGMENTADPLHLTRRAVLCQVLTDLSNFISSPLTTNGNRVNLWIRDLNVYNSIPSGAIGFASAFYNMPYSTNTNSGGITDSEIWKTINTGVDSYSNTFSPLVTFGVSPAGSSPIYHGLIALNFRKDVNNNPLINWHTNLSTTASVGSIDLYTVILHEMLHALGFASLIDENGVSKFGNGFNFFNRYDRFLKSNETTPRFLLTNSSSSCSMYNFGFNSNLLPSILRPGCTSNPPTFGGTSGNTACGSAILYTGSSTVPVYTPTCFERPSSLSHFEDQCIGSPNGNNNNAHFVMTDTSPFTIIKRYPKLEERNVLCDLGYTVSNTYGVSTTFDGVPPNNYYSPTCSGGITVAGVNDGLIGQTFTYIIDPSVSNSINISGIVANDVGMPTTPTIECLQDIYDTSATINGITSFSGNANNLIFSTTTPGLHLLRYVPVNGTQKGNITYVFVFVFSPSNCSAPPSSCNLVLNGGFEVSNGIPDNVGQFHSRVCSWRTVYPGGNSVIGDPSTEYFHTNSPSINADIPCNFVGVQNVNNNNGNAYAGMFVTKNYANLGFFQNESIETELISTLLPNKNYQLSFDLSLSESVSIRPFSIQAYLSPSLVTVSSLLAPIVPTNPNYLFSSNFICTNATNWDRIVINIRTDNTDDLRFLSIGALTRDAQDEQGVALPIGVQGCLAYSNLNSTNSAYYYIDNVSLIALEDSSITLPNSVCLGQNINNLGSFLTNLPLNGVFTGTGVTSTTNNGIVTYNFNSTTGGLGNRMITYTYTNSSGCQIPLYHYITVSSCSSTSCPGTLVFNAPETATLATYQAANTIVTNTNYVVNAGTSITMVAGNSITIGSSAHIKANTTSGFTAKIGPCTQTSARKSEEITDEQLLDEDKVTLFPNPTNEVISISTHNSDLIKLTVYSIDGKMIFSQSIEKTNSYQFNMTNYKSGIYLAIIETENGKTHRKKIIKN